MKIIQGSMFNGGRVNEPENRSNLLSGKDAAALRKEREKEREASIRKFEDKRLEKLNELIIETELQEFSDDPALSNRIKSAKIEGLQQQIKQIHEARAQREADKARRDAEEKAREAEEKQKENERRAIERGDKEALTRMEMEGMMKLSQSIDSIRELKRVKASLQAEAGHLGQAIENSFGTSKFGRVKNGYNDLSDFRNKHMARLAVGIGNLDAAISSEIAAASRKSQDIAENEAEAIKKPASEKDGSEPVTVEDMEKDINKDDVVSKSEEEKADEEKADENA